MKILQCINSLSSGGAEVFAADLAIAQQISGCEVKVFSYCGAIDDKGRILESNLKYNGIPHISPLLRKNHLKPLIPFHLKQVIDDFKPDICHSHLEQSDFFVWISSILSKNKPTLVRTIHNVYAPKVLPKIIHQKLSNAYAASIACSNAVFDQYPHLGRNPKVINNGINLSGFSPRLKPEEVRSQLNISGDTALLVHIGAFSIRNNQLQKSQDIIIRSLTRLKSSNCVVVFLGEGDQRSSIEALAESLGVLSNCRFLGRVLNPADYVFAADGVLMPSRFEGLSIGCIEAVCAGKPVIASKISAFNSFDQPSTIYVAPESIEDLAIAIDRLLNKKEYFKDLAEQQQASYRSNFDMKAVSENYLKVYDNLIGSKIR